VNVERPDLSHVDPAVRAYIEALEAELDRLRHEAERAPPQPRATQGEVMEPSEPPTTLNVVTISAAGVAKRTPRHLYARQRRGGMGVFDLDTPQGDPPARLTIADESQELLLFTTLARPFRLPVSEFPASPVRGRGQSLVEKLSLQPGERLALALPDEGRTYLALLSQRGFVRPVNRPYLRTGTALYDAKTFGPPAAACWTSGRDELLVATRRGLAIRFPERGIPVSGGQGIRLTGDDAAVAVVAVGPDDSVFLLGADGMGTIRLMSGFRPNKAPGAGGKIALKTDHLVGAVGVDEAADLFIVSRLGKIIRFQTAEVPAKEGVVQGVRCMALRADEVVAVTS
jgi:DNA gyrase subunit A